MVNFYNYNLVKIIKLALPASLLLSVSSLASPDPLSYKNEYSNVVLDSHAVDITVDSYGDLSVYEKMVINCSKNKNNCKLSISPIWTDWREQTNKGSREVTGAVEIKENGVVQPFVKTYQGNIVTCYLLTPDNFSIESLPEEEMSSEHKKQFLENYNRKCGPDGLNVYEFLKEPAEGAANSGDHPDMHYVYWGLSSKMFRVNNASVRIMLPLSMGSNGLVAAKITDFKGKDLGGNVDIKISEDGKEVVCTVEGGLQKTQILHVMVTFPSNILKSKTGFLTLLDSKINNVTLWLLNFILIVFIGNRCWRKGPSKDKPV